MMARFGYLLLALVALSSLGCASSESFSDSSNSSSESVSNSSNALSRSSSPDGAKTSYRDDVRSYTAGYARGGGQINDAYQKQLAQLARRHGISNWEDSKTTFRGVGEGLGQAGVGQPELDMYMAGLARSDADKRKAMQEGFNSQKP